MLDFESLRYPTSQKSDDYWSRDCLWISSRPGTWHKITASDTAGTNLDERSQAEEKKTVQRWARFQRIGPSWIMMEPDQYRSRAGSVRLRCWRIDYEMSTVVLGGVLPVPWYLLGISAMNYFRIVPWSLEYIFYLVYQHQRRTSMLQLLIWTPSHNTNIKRKAWKHYTCNFSNHKISKVFPPIPHPTMLSSGTKQVVKVTAVERTAANPTWGEIPTKKLPRWFVKRKKNKPNQNKSKNPHVNVLRTTLHDLGVSGSAGEQKVGKCGIHARMKVNLRV